ncbi:PHB depolymerase family esterase [Sphingobium sufflavum]|uniref:extracellular catalytic domain type 1 short-chain-length polyhydroxyalkanoate depolymerase n=1 Tax=Sphingobium sufflavum TaxID=1129547 RepID=UPI001F1981DE|nr:PHB depolymerase family esterase [Sphingobium sufflavum]MCE7798151.1 PHB depolymerase family esterase [Sphingobium sufflavum]
MADLFKTLLKAARLTRKARPLSAAFALGDAIAPPGRPVRRPTSKPKTRKVSHSRPRRPPPGSFITDEFRCAHGALTYKFYTPLGSPRRRMPLVVMLHGCSQSAADFASGTGMNILADELGFLVLYPQQSHSANFARCWNWHNPAHQVRGRGEPAVIAALTHHAIALGRANPARIYIAGLSAGGAAAATIGAVYRELFMAVGVHSGVARGNVRSIRAAISAMRGDTQTRPATTATRPIPTIVFHGDQDRVVHPSNASAFLRDLERSHSGPLVTRSVGGRSDKGRSFTRKIHKSSAGDVLLEDWTVHGGGHGWSGGHGGSFTDPSGPDASREMMRFFLSVRRRR